MGVEWVHLDHDKDPLVDISENSNKVSDFAKSELLVFSTH